MTQTQPNPLRVLVVSSKYPPEYSGAGLRAHRTYSRLRARYAIATQVLCSSMINTGWRNANYTVDGVSVTRISSPLKKRFVQAANTQPSGSKGWSLLWYALYGLDECVRTIVFLVRHRREIDVVHTFGHSWSGGVAAIWAGLWKKPIFRELVTMRSRPDDPPGLRRWVRWALRRNGTIIAISPRLAQLAKNLGYQRVWCRPNPIDSEQFRIDRSKRLSLRRAHTPFGPEDILLVDLSKYSRIKNKDLLVRALSLLPERYKLLIAGPLEESDQSIYQELCHLVETLGLQQRVVLQHGFIREPAQIIQMADVFVFASISDGLGTPVLEAICCGVPVVAHRLAGVTDAWLKEGMSGVLCEATPEAFAQAVQQAVLIPEPVLDEAAHELASSASTNLIDGLYASKLGQETGRGW